MDRGDLALVSVVVPEAVGLEGENFREAAVAAYDLMLRTVHGLAAHHPVRLWNFIPALLEPLAGYPHRYMAFNAGRFEAYRQWYDSEHLFPATIATASGTGTFGRNLVLHCLGSQAPGVPVENPRQIPAYLYSDRFGPRPPCFARATRLALVPGEPPWLLVGGTASVRGEDSVHCNDRCAQARETFENLSALLRAALEGLTGRDLGEVSREELLKRFTSLRVYFPEAAARDEVEVTVRAHFPHLETIEMVHSDLCRPELLLEIEGVADLSEDLSGGGP